jgi:hypothetical protein
MLSLLSVLVHTDFSTPSHNDVIDRKFGRGDGFTTCTHLACPRKRDWLYLVEEPASFSWHLGHNARLSLALLICTWTVVHLNVPAKEHSAKSKTLQRLSLVAVGMCLLEAVLLNAWAQFRRANNLSNEMALLRLDARSLNIVHRDDLMARRKPSFQTTAAGTER